MELYFIENEIGDEWGMTERKIAGAFIEKEKAKKLLLDQNFKYDINKKCYKKIISPSERHFSKIIKLEINKELETLIMLGLATVSVFEKDFFIVSELDYDHVQDTKFIAFDCCQLLEWYKAKDGKKI